MGSVKMSFGFLQRDNGIQDLGPHALAGLVVDRTCPQRLVRCIAAGTVSQVAISLSAAQSASLVVVVMRSFSW